MGKYVGTIDGADVGYIVGILLGTLDGNEVGI